MRRTILVWTLLSTTMAIGQQSGRSIFFEQKKPSAGVPFAWPSTWADVSSSSVTRADVLRFLADLNRDAEPQMLTAIQSFRFVPLEKDKFYLVADVDASANGFFGDLRIVRCEGAACVVSDQLTVAEDLDTDLVDVSGELLRLANSGEPGGAGISSAADDARNALLRRAEAKLAPPPANETDKQ